MAPSDHGDDDTGLSDFADTPSKTPPSKTPPSRPMDDSVEDLTVEQEEEVVVVDEDKSADGAKEKNNTGADEANDEANTAVDIPLQFIGDNTPGSRRKRGKIGTDPNSLWADVKRLKGVPKERDDLFDFTHVCVSSVMSAFAFVRHQANLLP